MAYSPGLVQTLRLDSQGRTVIPVEFRRALGLGAGDALVGWVEDDRLVLRSRRAVARELRGVFRDTAVGRSLVSELIAERREETEREGDGT
jgi:bifunctional DNA-binding transcriptional regulator/antitoxin component of YhaV-PrlF toxin-antitoxin module